MGTLERPFSVREPREEWGFSGPKADLGTAAGCVYCGLLPVLCHTAVRLAHLEFLQAAALHSQLHPYQPVHIFHAAGNSHPHPRPSASSNWPLSWGSGPSPVESGPSCLSHSPGHDPVLRGRQLYVAAGGGHLPAQPPGPCGRLRGGPLPLLHARRLGCWERNDIKAIWWIIRTPILLTILVRPAPPPPGGLRDFPSWEARRYALFPRRFRAWVCLTLSLQINFIIFIRILGILVSKVRTRQMRCPDYRLRLARSTLTLVPLLGVHEVVFAPVTEEQARGTLRLAKLGFEIFLSSFQGFLVSILYCFINKEVQSEIRRGWHRCRLRHSLGGEEPRQPRERAFPTLSSGSGPGQVVAGRALCSRALPGPGVEASRVLESYC
ncbi:gastric inhibitory polypeptide receptor isoform X4 [Camelus bactrianus]|uniref:Gastric inhibitory polypeptide receptor isoform X4 n=1 Tax=Camelus bactrianus TaxID=9837 RepID=A0AC58QT93_CAMBA